MVGYYRAQRQTKLRLAESDLALAKTFFHDRSNVILLIQPENSGPPNATFFFWDGGSLNGDFPFLEFPFDAELLAAAGQRRLQSTQQLSLKVLPPPTPVSTKPRRTVLWKPLIGAVLVIGAIGGAAAGVRYFLETSQWHQTQPIPASPPRAATELVPQPSIGLHAERQSS